MFKKPFKLKSQNQLKSTEKKKLASDLKVYFPALTEDDISSVLNTRECIVKIKLISFRNDDVDVYCIDKMPLFIDMTDHDLKVPTVFMMWRFPHIIPTITVNASVLNKLKNGADLFFPGIYLEGLLCNDKDIKRGKPVCINLIDNKAVVAVGVSLLSKQDIMSNKDNKDSLGKVVQIHHIIDDYLYKMQADSVLKQLGPPEWALKENEKAKLQNDDELDEKKLQCDSQVNKAVAESELLNLQECSPNICENSNSDNSDSLLEYCFMKALKTIPKNAYPILPATFYAKYILANLPAEKSINLKKTKWKKFSIFLQEKNAEGFIKLQQLPKNECTILSGNTEHPAVREFVDPYCKISVTVEQKNDQKPTVQQIYLVSTSSLPFFSKFGFKKNDELTRNHIRGYLSDYIKRENIANPDKPDIILLDSCLGEMFKEETMSRANLLSELLKKMTVQHKVTNCKNGQTIFHKGKMPMIEFETCLRMGNKKVTLISNLESFGVSASVFSKELQHKAAASTTIVASVPGKKGPQVQVQGNQVAVAFAILKEKYNLNEKCMKGLEKAVKPKNKK